MLTSKERVIRAIERRSPDKMPIWIGFDGAECHQTIVRNIQKEFDSDIAMTYCFDPDFKPVAPGYSWLGYKSESFGVTLGEVKDNPLKDWESFDRWSAALPDYSKASCYDCARDCVKNNPDKYVVGCLFQLMEEIINLRGYENYMIDLFDEEENLVKLIDRIYELANHMIDGYADAGVDAVISWEDWGLQDSPMMSFGMWEHYFRKKMTEFVEHIHARGMKYILHSCGHITYLMDVFAEMKIDVLQLDQQMNMGLDTLQKWQDKFCFSCPVDIQHSVGMTKEQTEQYVALMAEKLGGKNGGFIFKPYPQPAAINMTEEKLRHELSAASKL